MNGLIQGNNAVLSLFKNDWVPFLCATDITVSVSADILPVRTPNDGHWAKNTYQKLSYKVSISGLLILNNMGDSNWTGMDMLTEMFGFVFAKWRIAYTSNEGVVKSLEGSGVVDATAWNASTSALVKNDTSITGDGELKFFDGLIPCNATITGITPTGMTGGTGIVTITYTYTGSPYQVKWRLNGMGPYFYALLGVSIVTPALAAGSYSIEIVPVCANGYESDNSASTVFAVTLGLTCSATTSAISTSGGSLRPTFTGSPSQWQYSIDGAAFTTVSVLVTAVDISALSVGAHTVSVIPICSNGVSGTGILNQAFTVTASPTTFTIAWVFSSFVAGNTFTLFVNGVASVSTSTPGSGTITGPAGSTIITRIIGNNNTGSFVEMKTQDTTTSTVLDDQTGHCPVTLNYTFVVSGDTYGINATVTP